MAGEQFGEHVAHLRDEGGDQRAEKRLVAGEAELTAVSNGAAEDPAQHIVAAVVAGHDAIGNRERQRAQVVGNDAEGDGGLELIGKQRAVGAGLRVDVDVGLAAELLELAEQRLEDVGGVVARFGGKVGEALGALDDRAGALEAHAGIDVLGGQFAERSIGLGIVLDENEVPDFDAEVGVVVDEFALRVAVRGEIDVEFRAGAAGAGLAHHPEVVLDAAKDDVDGGVAAFGAEQGGPQVPGFLVELAGIAGLRAINRGVEAVGRQAPAIDHQLPGPGDGFLLEVIAERPIAEHFKKRVVIGVVADVFEVVVFAAGADALLGIGGAGRIVGGFFDAEEKRHERVHPGIGEEQTGRLRQQRGGRHNGVLLFTEKTQEALADGGGSHGRTCQTTNRAAWHGKYSKVAGMAGWNGRLAAGSPGRRVAGSPGRRRPGAVVSHEVGLGARGGSSPGAGVTSWTGLRMALSSSLHSRARAWVRCFSIWATMRSAAAR